jgi:hypothetical protein
MRSPHPVARWASLANVQDVTGQLKGPQGALGVLLGNEADAQKLVRPPSTAPTPCWRARTRWSVGWTGWWPTPTARCSGPVRRPRPDPGWSVTVRTLVQQLDGLLADTRGSLQKVDAVLVEAQGIASNTREATTDLGALRAEVESSLRQIESLVNDINRAGRLPATRRSACHEPSCRIPDVVCVAVAPGQLLALAVLLVACGSNPLPPDWQMSARASLERAQKAGLTGLPSIEVAEMARVRRELARTGRADLLARAELGLCAARVAALDFSPCEAYEALAGDAAEAEQAYARYLAGQPLPGDAVWLPEAQRPLVAGGEAARRALPAVADPLSRLVGAAVLMRRGDVSPEVIALAVIPHLPRAGADLCWPGSGSSASAPAPPVISPRPIGCSGAWISSFANHAECAGLAGAPVVVQPASSSATSLARRQAQGGRRFTQGLLGPLRSRARAPFCLLSFWPSAASTSGVCR